MISRRGEWRTWERRNPGTLGKKPKEFTVLAPRRATQFHLIGRIRIRIVTRWTDASARSAGISCQVARANDAIRASPRS